MNEKSQTFSRSDDLSFLLPFLESYAPGLKQFVKFRLIVDANVILAELRWLLLRAEAEHVRTNLLELLESNAIDCFAPTFLCAEVEGKLWDFHLRYGVDLKKAEGFWGRFEERIQFIEVGGPGESTPSVRDPKDLPYIRLQQLLGAPIVTKDGDVAAMGGKVAHHTVVADLRDYARSSAVHLKIMLAGGVTVSIPTMVVGKAVNLLVQWLAPALRRIPPWVWVAAALLMVALVVLPSSRKWLMAQASNSISRLEGHVDELLTELEPVFTSYNEARHQSTLSLERINAKLV